MSYTKEVTLWCDADDCQEWAQFNHHESRGGKVADARITARRIRWTFVDGKDYCKAHSTIVQKIAPDPMFNGPSVSLADIQNNAGQSTMHEDRTDAERATATGNLTT